MQFDKWFKKDPSGIDKAVSELLSEMEMEDGDSEKYAKLVDQLDKLMKMRTYTKDTSTWVAPTISAASTLLGIIVIVTFEAAGHSPVSKALTIFKPKI